MSRRFSLTIAILSLLGFGFSSSSGNQKTLLTIAKQGW